MSPPLKWEPKKFVAVDEATKAVVSLWEDKMFSCWRWKIVRSGGRELAHGDCLKLATARSSVTRKFNALRAKGELNNLIPKADR